MPSRPNSSGHGLSEATHSVALAGLVAEGIELTTVTLELVALRLDDLGRRLRGETLVREHSLGAGDFPFEPVDFSLWVSLLRACVARASKMRVSSGRAPFAHRSARRRRGLSFTRSRAPSSAANESSGSSQGATISRDSRVGQVRPDLLGHVRQHRVEKLEQALERGERGRPRVLVAAVEPRLDRLCVPVTEVVEREAVEPPDRAREVVLRDIALELGRVASMRARIQRSSTSRGLASGVVSPALARISRATFQSLFARLRPSAIGPTEKRTSCVDDIFRSP